MSNVKIYSLKRDGEKYVTTNIQVKELRSHDGADEIKNDLVVTSIVQFVRDYYKKPALIERHSAYRTVSWNKHEGGSSDSRHCKGLAIDFEIAGVKPQEYANLCYSLGCIRVGVYGNFTHVDTDRSPKWLSQGNFKKVNVPYQGILLKKGVKHYLVTIVQYRLNCLGYNCGIEDGVAGNLFNRAVIKFQKDKGLTQDGKCGNLTWNKLFN